MRSCLIAILAAGCIVQPASAQTVAPKWVAAASYTHERFDDDAFADWDVMGVSVQRRGARGSLALDAAKVSRFALDDVAITSDGYLVLWPRAYANLRVQLAHDADVLPGIDAGGEVFQAFGSGWEASVGARWMDYEPDAVSLYSAALARYNGAWYLRGRGTLVPADDGSGLLFSGLARRYLADGPLEFVELSAGAGDEVATLAPGVTELRTTRFGHIRAQRFLTSRFGAVGGMSYADQEGLPVRLGVTLGLLARW